MDIVGQPTYTNAQIGLEDGDIVLFLESGVYSTGIYQVNGVNASITLTQLHAPNSYADLDKVLILHGPDLPGISTGYPGLELYWNDGAWTQGQQKDYRSEYPLFQLYDDTGVPLQEYQENDFTGDPIFRYTPNTAGVFDPELGFAPSYNEQNLNNDINFELTLNTVKYFTDLGTPSAREIVGYYYAKDIVNVDYTNGWSKIRGSQRTNVFKTHIAKSGENVSFSVDVDNTEHITRYFVEYNGNGYRFTTDDVTDIDTFGETNPNLVWQTDTEYTLYNVVPDSSKLLTITNPYGQFDPNITVITGTQNEYKVTVSSNYEYSTIYYMESDGVYGIRVYGIHVYGIRVYAIRVYAIRVHGIRVYAIRLVSWFNCFSLLGLAFSPCALAPTPLIYGRLHSLAALRGRAGHRDCGG